MTEEEPTVSGVAAAVKNSAILGLVVLLLGVTAQWLKITGDLESAEQERKAELIAEDRRRTAIESRLITLESHATENDEDHESLINVDSRVESIEQGNAATARALANLQEKITNEIDTFNTFRIGEYSATQESNRIGIGALEKVTQEIVGDLGRLTKDVSGNSDFKVVQEKRATVRIEQQKSREERLIKVEGYIEDERNRDSRRADQFETEVQDLKFRVRELEDELKIIESANEKLP